jgi:hypothetical protein
VLLNRLRQPLHSDAIFPGSGDFYYRAKANGKQYSCELVRGGAEQPMRFRDQDYAMCAFHSVNLEHQQEKHCAIIYLSQEHGGQIYTIDANKQSELFFSLPAIPERGVDIYNELAESSQKKVTEKFKEAFPEEYRRLLELELPAPTNNLHSLWAVASVMLGLKSRSMYVDDLRDALLSAALAHRGHNSPRIDFPLTKGEEDNSFNWRKTLGTMISFRLADDRDKSKLAFGTQDSLADYLSGWIDNLDHNIGIESVILAGSEWTNQVLTRRVTLRIGKNFQLKHNQLLEIDGNNLAIGALLLKKRRF